MAFASRQARGRRWRNRWRCRASSTAANSSSSRGLTIRCQTMTAIHRSGRCDKRDMKSRRGCRMEPFRSLPPHDHRRQQGNERKPLRSEGEGRQCATMSPDIRIAAPHCYTYRTESPLHSEFVGRPPATLEKRIPINCGATYHKQSPKIVSQVAFLLHIGLIHAPPHWKHQRGTHPKNW